MLSSDRRSEKVKQNRVGGGHFFQNPFGIHSGNTHSPLWHPVGTPPLKLTYFVPVSLRNRPPDSKTRLALSRYPEVRGDLYPET